MEFHGVDVGTQFKRMRELAPESYRAFLDFDKQAFQDGAIPGKTQELSALGHLHGQEGLDLSQALGEAHRRRIRHRARRICTTMPGPLASTPTLPPSWSTRLTGTSTTR